MDCSSCHLPTTWKVLPKHMKFDHDTMTSFPLVGQHASLSCASCHKTLVFYDVKSNCISCHTDVHKASLGDNCRSCHIPRTWIVSNIEQMHQRTRFPLVGAHENVDCTSCHTSYSQMYFPPINTACITCHSQQYYSTTAPSHVQSGFSTQCQSCHTVMDVSWGPTKFDHSFFPLTGGHAIANCFACHKQGTANNFTGLSTNCYSCHSAQFAATTTPNHVTAGFPQNCAQCHTVTTWTTATFDHNTTGFSLTGEHANLQCQQCHFAGYANTPSTCSSCHTTDYANAVTPVNHAAAGLPKTCQTCHTTMSPFTTTTFAHPTSPFQLTGAHMTVACQSCHKGSVTSTPTDCYSCHQTDFASTTNPPHASQGFPTTCTQCHSTTDWTSATFDHNTTGFPLTGEHANLQCQQCHSNGYATAPSTACQSCHQTDYSNATTPVNHVAAGLPTTCQTCHITMSPFTTTTFTHPTSPFQLTGAHMTVGCQSCHKGSVTNTPTDCYSCHQTDYASTTNPPHASQGFPTTCTQCHSTTDWTSATFDHSTTGFPLTGAHTTVQCAQCHTNGYTAPPATQCISCHQTDYNNTTNPAHASAGYPTDCTQCHTTAGWTPSTFNHSQFPITAGTNHAAPPLLCSNCHTDVTNFAIFSCTNSGCHTQANTDKHHNSVNGYVYSPTSCYTCHPTGKGD